MERFLRTMDDTTPVLDDDSTPPVDDDSTPADDDTTLPWDDDSASSDEDSTPLPDDDSTAFLFLGPVEGERQWSDCDAQLAMEIWVDGTPVIGYFHQYHNAPIGDTNGDGFGDVLVGADTWPGTEYLNGAVNVFLGPLNGLEGPEVNDGAI